MESPASAFHDPPWDAPLDTDAVLARIPPDATMKGVYLEAIAKAARVNGAPLPSARSSYTKFKPYPLREHCTLLVEAARHLWPERTLRHALRSLGRGAPGALVGSTLGRVMVGSVEGPLEVLRAMAKTYSLLASPGEVEVVDAAPGRALLHLRDVPFFVDCHHVGVYEGALKFGRASRPRVRVRTISHSEAELLCEWE